MTDLLNIHPTPTTSINSRSHQPNIPSILKQMEQQWVIETGTPVLSEYDKIDAKNILGV